MRVLWNRNFRLLWIRERAGGRRGAGDGGHLTRIIHARGRRVDRSFHPAQVDDQFQPGAHDVDGSACCAGRDESHLAVDALCLCPALRSGRRALLPRANGHCPKARGQGSVAGRQRGETFAPDYFEKMRNWLGHLPMKSIFANVEKNPGARPRLVQLYERARNKKTP